MLDHDHGGGGAGGDACSTSPHMLRIRVGRSEEGLGGRRWSGMGRGLAGRWREAGGAAISGEEGDAGEDEGLRGGDLNGVSSRWCDARLACRRRASCGVWGGVRHQPSREVRRAWSRWGARCGLRGWLSMSEVASRTYTCCKACWAVMRERGFGCRRRRSKSHAAPSSKLSNARASRRRASILWPLTRRCNHTSRSPAAVDVSSWRKKLSSLVLRSFGYAA
mmetsp:Transcript_6848/g.11758  ORF Transcript_6848/g.11758 Transcript_6848/m.11758 type:complete len:221 (-) Transcript_6848:1042-1704(-)